MIKVCREAAMKGHTDILECATIFGIDLIKVRKQVLIEGNLIEKFSQQGNLEMIQYFDRKKLLRSVDGDDWIEIFELATESEHLHIMKWILQEKSHLIQSSDDEAACRATIAAYEHIRTGVTAPEMTFELYDLAVRNGDIEALEYCHRSNFQFDIDTRVCNSSMENKDKEQALKTLKWLRQHDSPWDEALCSSAALNENLEALKWARNNGCAWSRTTLSAAAESGNIPIIEYCLQSQCPMTSYACSAAMKNKDESTAIETSKLLRKHSCPWDKFTCATAILYGHFEALRWVRRNSCPFTEDVFRLLVTRGNVSMIEEFLQDEPRHDTNDIFKAALSDQLSHSSHIIGKLKLLREYGYRWNANTALEAVKQRRVKVLQWLRFMGCDLDLDYGQL